MAVLRGSGEGQENASPGTGWNNMPGYHQLHTWPFQSLFYNNYERNSPKPTFLQILQHFILTAVKCNASKAHGMAAGDGCPGALAYRCHACCYKGGCWGFPHFCPPAHCIGGRSWESMWTASQDLRLPETFNSAQQTGRMQQKAALVLPVAKAL